MRPVFRVEACPVAHGFARSTVSTSYPTAVCNGQPFVWHRVHFSHAIIGAFRRAACLDLYQYNPTPTTPPKPLAAGSASKTETSFIVCIEGPQRRPAKVARPLHAR